MQPRLWISFDCETTGFLPDARLLEIGAVAFREDGVIEAEFQRLVSPPVALPPCITTLTGITEDMLRNADSAGVVLAEFLDWIPPNGILVAHNIPFDLAIIDKEQRSFFESHDPYCVDSLTIARQLGEFPNHRLETICKILVRSPGTHRHRALNDAHVVCRLMLHAFSRKLHQQYPKLFEGQPASTWLRLFPGGEQHRSRYSKESGHALRASQRSHRNEH